MIPKTQGTCASLLVLMALPVCLAQKPQGTSLDKMTDQTIRVVHLEHADATLFYNAIEKLGLLVNAVTISKRTVLLRGPAAELQRVIDQILPLIDVPDMGADTETSTDFIPLSIEPTSELIGLLEAVVYGPWSRIAIDATNRMLVVRASEEEMEAVRELIEKIDRPRESLTVHFFFIRATISGESNSDGPNLPAALKPIAKTLSDNGFGNPSLMAPITVVAHGSREFESDSTLRLGDSPDGKNQLSFSVQGVARLDPDGETVQLTVGAAMYGEYGDEETGEFNAHFEVDTTIAMKLDSYMILAASPSSTPHGNAVALVVRVTKQTIASQRE